MKKNGVHSGLFLLLTGVLLTSCSALQKPSDPYSDAWEEVLESRSWKASLDAQPRASGQGETQYAIPNYQPLESATADPEFLKRYPALVSRAYFRLIAEAMDSDRRVAKSYQELYRKSRQPETRNDPVLQREYETARKRFLAHREMLEGLRSWNAFNEYGSDDLDFFMQEQLEVAYGKYERGVKEDPLVDYLMRRLADLYHLRYGGVDPSELFPG
jgi:hypothetical protein